MKLATIDIETVSPDKSDPWGALAAFKHSPPIISLLGAEFDGTVYQTWWPDGDDHTDMLRGLNDLVDKGVALAGWNIIFDLSVLFRYHPGWRALAYKAAGRGLLVDGMDIEKRADRMYGLRTHKYGYSLGATCARYGLPEWKDDVVYDVTPGDTPIGLELYHAADLRNTTDVCQRALARCDSADIDGVAKDGAIIPVFCDSYLAGWRVNKATLVRVQAADEQRQQHTLNDIQATLGSDVTPDVMRSPTKMRHWLFKTKGYPVLRYTNDKQDTEAADSQVVTVLSLKYPELRPLVEWKKLETRINRFYEATSRALQYTGTGCVHPQPRLANTYTGRSTYSAFFGKPTAKIRRDVAPAMHQIERGEAVRQIFVADDDKQIAEFDVAGQEMRELAWLSGDLRMLEAFNNGMDLHSLTTSTIFGMRYDSVMERLRAGDSEVKVKRGLGKEVNLASQYRMGWRTLKWRVAVRAGIQLTDYEAKQYRQGYLDTWPSVPEYWAEAIARARVRGYAETVGGRKVRLDYEDGYEYSCDQSAINTPIQGTGGDMKVAIIHALLGAFERRKCSLKLELHDGVYLSVDDGHAAGQIANRLNAIDWAGWFKQKTIPLQFPVEASIGASWGSLKPLGGA